MMGVVCLMDSIGIGVGIGIGNGSFFPPFFPD